MKLKMAHGSLFAVLLRSPWWISLGIAAAIVVAVRTNLAPEHWLFGAMGALPFIVITGIAAWRQLRAPSPARVAAALEAAAAMSWRDFASAVENAYAQDGYAVTRLDGTAADFALQKAGRTTLVSCKRWKAANVGTEALRELAAAQSKRDASLSRIVTLGALSDAAARFARENHIEVVQGAALAQLLRAVPSKPAAGATARR